MEIISPNALEGLIGAKANEFYGFWQAAGT
jgi:hypothetical protein